MPGFIGARSARYGWTHQKARATAFRQLPEWSPCARCHRMMWKHAKDKQGRSAIHYDHHDWVAGKYLGFSHHVCNRIAGASKGGRVAKARRQAVRTRHTYGIPTAHATPRAAGGQAARPAATHLPRDGQVPPSRW